MNRIHRPTFASKKGLQAAPTQTGQAIQGRCGSTPIIRLFPAVSNWILLFISPTSPRTEGRSRAHHRHHQSKRRMWKNHHLHQPRRRHGTQRQANAAFGHGPPKPLRLGLGRARQPDRAIHRRPAASRPRRRRSRGRCHVANQPWTRLGPFIHGLGGH